MEHHTKIVRYAVVLSDESMQRTIDKQGGKWGLFNHKSFVFRSEQDERCVTEANISLIFNQKNSCSNNQKRLTDIPFCYFDFAHSYRNAHALPPYGYAHGT